MPNFSIVATNQCGFFSLKSLSTADPCEHIPLEGDFKTGWNDVFAVAFVTYMYYDSMKNVLQRYILE
jgi:hypothetical protein